MILSFTETNHHYQSDPPRKWTSSTKVVEMFCNEFDAEAQAWRSSANKNSKWFGMDPAIIRAIWDAENERSTREGHKFHEQQEKKAIKKGCILHRGKLLTVIDTPFIDGVKIALRQEIAPGCYLEHMVYDEEYGVCGQTDLAISDDEYLDILDYKTNKEIKVNGYGWQYGSPQRMLSPISHLEDCNYNHYSLQLSIYMYLALKKNPKLKAGKMEMIHVQFKIKELDFYGYPILEYDQDSNPIVTKVTKYNLPYLEKEVKDCFEWMKRFPNTI